MLTVIHNGQGSDKLPADLLANAVVSTVNLAEVQSKLVSKNWDPEEAWEDARGIVHEAVPFTAEHAKTAGSLIAEARPLGLSLGERACLALALDLKAPVYTADRSWRNLKVGVHIHVIR